jgi:hypothetical protein
MGKYSEVFVAFDVAKKKHAVAIAEGGRTGEVRFLGDVENSPLPIERTIKRLADRYDRHVHCRSRWRAIFTGRRSVQKQATEGDGGLADADACFRRRAQTDPHGSSSEVR